MKYFPPPPNTQVIEALASAPNFLSLQAAVQALHENFPHAPKTDRQLWFKCADEILIRWIREAVEPSDTSYYYSSTLTVHSWPTSDKGREKIREACRNRWKQQGVEYFGTEKL